MAHNNENWWGKREEKRPMGAFYGGKYPLGKTVEKRPMGMAYNGEKWWGR